MSKKIIRLTESQLKNVIKRIIKEDEEEWVSQAQDMEDESDFSKMDLKQNKDFQELVSFFEENPDIAQEIKSAMEGNISEAHKYYDYSGTRGKEEITRKQYLKRKLINYGIWGTLGAIVGYTMGGMSGDDVLQAALLMAGSGGTLGAELSGNVGRERIKEDIQKEDFYSTLIKSGPKPGVGGEYCFTKQDVNSIFKAGGYKGLEGFKNHYKLHLVKKGQTFNQIEDYEMANKLVDINRSKRCGSGLRKKELRAGDVLLVSILPGM